MRQLTERERFILQRKALGDTYRQAGRALGITESGAQARANAAVRKLGARNIVHAVALALDADLIHPLDCGQLRTYWWHLRHHEYVDSRCAAAHAADLRRLRALHRQGVPA